jgi:hypothetical protein
MRVVDIRRFVFGGVDSSPPYGTCRLRVYHFNRTTTVIVTAVYDTDGMRDDLPGLTLNITTGIADIANRVHGELCIAFDALIEHYPARISRGKLYSEEFALVAFRQNARKAQQPYADPDWYFMYRSEVEGFIGQPLD